MDHSDRKLQYDFYGDPNFEDIGISIRLIILLVFQISLIILNVGSILVILTSEKLRNLPKYVLIINICIVCLVQALFLLSVFLLVQFYDYLLQDYCYIHYFTYLLGFLCTTLIVSFSAAVNTEYIIRTKSPGSFEGSRQYYVLAIVIILCYFVNIVVLTPIFHIFVKRLIYDFHGKEVCSYMILHDNHRFLLFALASIPHSTWAFFSAIAVVVYYVRYKLCRNIYIPHDIVTATIVIFGLCFLPVLIDFCVDDIGSVVGMKILRLAPLSTGLFLPFIWMMNPIYRQAVKDFITCNCCKPSLTSSYELVGHQRV